MINLCKEIENKPHIDLEYTVTENLLNPTIVYIIGLHSAVTEGLPYLTVFYISTDMYNSSNVQKEKNRSSNNNQPTNKHKTKNTPTENPQNNSPALKQVFLRVCVQHNTNQHKLNIYGCLTLVFYKLLICLIDLNFPCYLQAFI